MALAIVAKLLKRQVLGSDEEEEDEGHCPSNDSPDSQAEPMVGDHTFHDIMTYTCIACAILTVIVSGFLMLSQMRNYREPRVQKHLIRIILTAPVFAVLCTIGVANYGATHYVEPIAEAYEIFTLVSIFLLFIAYLVPSTEWDPQLAFFSNPTHGGYKFFKRRYILVMQVIPGRIITTIAALAITAMSCRSDRSFDRASTIITIVNSLQLILAISGIFPFMMKQRKTLVLVDPQIFGKLISVKLIVILQIIIGLVLQILTWTDSLDPTSTLSYNDLNLGLSSFLTTILAMVTAFLMIPYFRGHQFEHKPLADMSSMELMYQPGTMSYEEDGTMKMAGTALPTNVKPKQGMGRAFIDTINVFDVLQAFFRACKLLFNRGGYAVPSHQNER